VLAAYLPAGGDLNEAHPEIEFTFAVVGRAAELLRERSEEMTRTITLEMGKLIHHSRAELDLAARAIGCAQCAPWRASTVVSAPARKKQDNRYSAPRHTG